ncbi:autotransporter outer membrane beta-barrel domain-containing protein [Ancylobacter polymorphus]|uniref:Outer membrane autotransporter protein n=1 Tax=Ancylobacter polymorphus TaxID=223390 RepID=A0ABU0BEN8_9HYPH|nr:autotransporter outer membrane beta-barrel domain-containing protein [Ancylobacter polymorphus]MDQ0303517.1 outer membrane autotransporter protein [Ancylobacter polymorphus]
MSKKFATPRRGAGKAKLVIRRKAAPVAPAAVDHSKVALFGSASAVALAALLTVGFMASPVHAAPASCTETSPGSWFCNNNPPLSEGDIDGNADANTITIVGGSYSWSDDKYRTDINADDGNDIINIAPDSAQTPNGSIDIRGTIYGEGGDDTITFGGGSLTSPSGWTSLHQGDIDGGDGNDTINVTASDQVATYITQDGAKDAANILGGAGDDEINITNASKQGITIDGGVEGNSGADKITISQTGDSKTSIGDDIDGGTGADTIKLSVGTGELGIADLTGGDDNDTITVLAEDDGTFTAGDLKGGDGKDSITITGKTDGTFTAGVVDGGNGDDTIEIGATDSDVTVGDVKGGADNDKITLDAGDGGNIVAEDLGGGSGNDELKIVATDGGDVTVTSIDGGDGSDTVELKATDKGSTIGVTANIKGASGEDTITLTATDEGVITAVDITGGDDNDTITVKATGNRSDITLSDIEGGNGVDKISVIAEDWGEVEFVDIDGGDGADTIKLSAKDIGSNVRGENVEGGDGDDSITLEASKIGQVDVDDIKGGIGEDTISLLATEQGDITVDGDIDGGDDQDKITLTAENGNIGLVDLFGGQADDEITLEASDSGTITLTNGSIEGGSGEDTIGLTADGEKSKITLDNIDGGTGADEITLKAANEGDISVDGDIDGGDDQDKITLTAEDGNIDLVDLIGGQADDEIGLEATKGGTITLENLDGGTGEDTIGLKADGEGSKISLDNIYGDTGADDITLTATNGGEITLTENIEAGTGNDEISLSADGGSISLNDIEGGNGADEITLTGTRTEGTLITVDDIRGGEDDDDVTLSGLNNILTGAKNFEISGEIDGGDDFDRLYVENGSALSLNDVDGFQELHVETKSFLQLTQQTVKFNGADEREGLVQVDATSYLRLSDHAAVLETGNVVLDAAEGLDGYRSIYTGRDAGWLNQTGGVLDVSGYAVAVDDSVELSVTEGVTPDPLLPEMTFINNGTIALHNGISDVVGDRFTINGNYQGGGNLLIDTYLGASNSPTDILVINGDVAPGSTTTIYVNNTNTGEGVFTGSGLGQGIKVVDVAEYGVSPDDAFQLARNSVSGQREVMAGAYSYRLFQDPDNTNLSKSIADTGAGDWYLRAGYTAQATGYATAPSAIQRHFYGGLDTLNKRLGEVRQQDQLEGRNADLAVSATKAPAYQPVPAPKFQMWGRGGGSDLSYDVSNGWDFSQQSWGLQAGGDYTFDYDSWRITAGAFGGYGWSDVDVDGDWTSWGGSSSLNIDGWNAGVYASIRQVGLVRGAGFYTDIVGKVDVLDLDIASTSNVTANTNATVWGGSIEMGYGFDLGNSWVIQPQAQLAYVSANQDAYVDSIGTYVTPGDAESLIGRLGLQVQSTFVMATGQTITPYAIFNVNSEFLGDNKTNVAGTILTSDINGTWYNAGIGFTADLNGSVALFGNGEYNFGDVQGWAGQGGIKVRW